MLLSIRCRVEIFTVFPFLRKFIWISDDPSLWRSRPVPTGQREMDRYRESSLLVNSYEPGWSFAKVLEGAFLT